LVAVRAGKKDYHRSFGKVFLGFFFAGAAQEDLGEWLKLAMCAGTL